MSNVVNIDERTNIPLFAVFIALPVLFTGVFWLASLSARASFGEAKDVAQDVKLDAQMTIILDMRDRLVRIEANQKRGN